MDTTQILSSNLLDIIFEDRNKDYGAYELRKTYHKRIGRSLIITFTGALFVLICTAWASSKKSSGRERVKTTALEISKIKETEKKIDPPKPIQRQPPPQVQMKIFIPPIIVPDDKVENPPPQIEDLATFKIGDENRKGIDDIGTPDETKVDQNRNIIEQRKHKEDDSTYIDVQVEASFPGGNPKWTQFLERNCNGQVAVDNGAPEGNYTIMLQFVVDKEGNISDVRALTKHGYGMEEEAIRAIKKSSKWNPAIQNGVQVKAYRRQPITFQVPGE